jgi:isoquinoline 1-oxidoreductase beta subunit
MTPRADTVLRRRSSAGEFTLGVTVPERAAGTDETKKAGSADVTHWIVIRPDNSVVIRVARAEMGQGSFTGQPMLVCEELECDWTRVSAEYASPTDNLDNRFGSMQTGGSKSIREGHEWLLRAGACAREMLLSAAADKWRVPRIELKAEKSVITHIPTGRTVTYGEVAGAAAKLKPPEHVKLKDPAEWKLLGRDVTRFDVAGKAVGQPVYGIDVRLPGMLYATIAQCPVFEGKLTSFDASKVDAMPGVRRVLAVGDAVAVVADTYWHAYQALQSLPIVWDGGANAGLDEAAITNMLNDGITTKNAAVALDNGNVEEAIKHAATVLHADYRTPFVAHATMEPMNCTARVARGKVEIWVPSQNAATALTVAAEAAGVAPERVEVHLTMLGGGFGRRLGGFGWEGFVQQAVLIAKEMGTPVQLLWSRKEDMQHDFYRPVSMVRLTAALDQRGDLTAWKVRATGPSVFSIVRPEDVKDGLDLIFVEGLMDRPYEVPNTFVEYAMRNTPVPIGFWRSVYNSQNAFYRECFLDELAHAGGHDPYEFRRKLLAKQPKPLAVLDAAAKRAGWGSPLPAGVFRGIAYYEPRGSLVCQVAEVSVSARQKVKVHRIVCALDTGYVVNPDTVNAQVEGGIFDGLNTAFNSKITINNGRVEQTGFADYPMLRLRDMPKIEVVQVPSGGFWGGAGEVGLPPVAPAVCNAIFAATGKRLRSLPLRDHGFAPD